MLTYLFFLSSGLFLGWSLGANDASNIFGTAVGTKMLRFSFAAAIAGLFIVLGSVISGQNTADTLNELGGVNTLPAAFAVSLSSALAVLLMLKSGIPFPKLLSVVLSVGTFIPITRLMRKL